MDFLKPIGQFMLTRLLGPVWSVLASFGRYLAANPVAAIFLLFGTTCLFLYLTLQQNSRANQAEHSLHVQLVRNDSLIAVNNRLVADRDQAYAYADSISQNHNQHEEQQAEKDRQHTANLSTAQLRAENDSLLAAGRQRRSGQKPGRGN